MAERKDQQLKERVLDTAFEAFNQAGFSKVPVDVIARALRMSKKTIYKHFQSKEELLELSVQIQLKRLESKFFSRTKFNDHMESFLRIGYLYKEFLEIFSDQLRTEIRENFPYIDEQIVMFEKQSFRKLFSKTAKDLRGKNVMSYPMPTKELAFAFLALLRGIHTLPAEHFDFMIRNFCMGLGISSKTKRKKKK